MQTCIQIEILALVWVKMLLLALLHVEPFTREGSCLERETFSLESVLPSLPHFALFTHIGIYFLDFVQLSQGVIHIFKVYSLIHFDRYSPLSRHDQEDKHIHCPSCKKKRGGAGLGFLV